MPGSEFAGGNMGPGSCSFPQLRLIHPILRLHLHRSPVPKETLLAGRNIQFSPHFQCLVTSFRGSSIPGAVGCSGTALLFPCCLWGQPRSLTQMAPSSLTHVAVISRSAEHHPDLQNHIPPALNKPTFNMKCETSNLVSYQIITVVFKLLLVLVKQSQIRARGSSSLSLPLTCN